MIIPVLDIEPLRCDAQRLDGSELVARLDAACVESGFFVVVGHGVDEQMNAVFDAARRFFAVPPDAKLAVAMRDDRNGYVPLGASRTGDKEMFDIGFDGSGRWPDVSGFRTAVLDYQREALGVAEVLLRAIAVALDVEPSFFASRMRQPECFLRMLRYPSTSKDGSRSEPLPTGAHTDYGAITLLATDGVPGLETRTGNDDWTAVIAPEGSLVVNLGDMLARWTNGRYASTPHRVVGGNRAERYSIPLFVNPDPDTIVECIPSCVTAQRPCRYEPITATEFLSGRIDGTIATGDGRHG
ncbi:MAG: 2OG-Fe(II) oxygenase [Actinomycetota bacterium]|nr:2OG-Fe(II) oxygenase [Actinomycetota bacterium]